jgi:hypothetical protein
VLSRIGQRISRLDVSERGGDIKREKRETERDREGGKREKAKNKSESRGVLSASDMHKNIKHASALNSVSS